MTLFLYNLVLPFYLLLALPGLLVKMRRRGGYGAHFGQRFGRYDAETKSRLAGMPRPWWVHAVSVGEVLTALKLIDEMIGRNEGLPVVLTTTSSTGFATARAKAPPEVAVLYNPLDLPFTARRALEAIQPAQIILTESEIWPNLIALAHARKIPVTIVNARLSRRSGQRYARFRRLVAPVLSKLTAVLVPETEDVPRWEAAGVPKSRVHVVGSVKFDPASTPAPDKEQEACIGSMLESLWGPLEDTHRVLLGSSHRGEEALVAGVCRELRKRHPSLRCVVVPRHFERAAEVLDAFESLGLVTEQRSLWPRRRADGEVEVLLVDSTGELRSWYAFADIVVMGKSFLGEGGQNPAEPALAGKPVVFGPHMENFQALAAALTEAGGAIQVAEGKGLEAALEDLLAHPERRRELAEHGRACLERHRGATVRTVEKLLEFGRTSA